MNQRRKGLSDTTLMFIIMTVLFIISLAVTLVILNSVNIPILNKFKDMWEKFSWLMNNPVTRAILEVGYNISKFISSII